MSHFQPMMCVYKDLENIELPNGKTVKEVNAASDGGSKM